jgi:dienelactone hydrolase
MKQGLDYDPFARGPYPVGVRTFQARDKSRDRTFSCELWYPATSEYAGQDFTTQTQDEFAVPARNSARRQSAVRNAAAQPGSYPLIAYSHCSGGNRRSATFLCPHLSSWGYVVGALDHSETFVPELMRREGETPEQRAARADAAIASRVPDLRFLLDQVLDAQAIRIEATCDPNRIGIVGHSFGGWAVLSTPEVDPRIRAIVAHAPGGSSNPRPGILRATLTFDWRRDVPVLYLVAENDTPLPLDGMFELFERTRSAKQMVVLRRADHAHFMDDVEVEHETVRNMPVTGEWASMLREMLPIQELCSGERAYAFVRGLTLCHLESVLNGSAAAKDFLSGDLQGKFVKRGIEAYGKIGSST